MLQFLSKGSIKLDEKRSAFSLNGIEIVKKLDQAKIEI